jgi:hypothetical protein
VGRVGQPGGPFAGMVWTGQMWVNLSENQIAERAAIPDPIPGSSPPPPGWYRIAGVADQAHYWDGRTFAEHAEWIPRGVELPVAPDDMRTLHRQTTRVGIGDTAGHRGWAARGAWWSLGIVSVVWGVSMVASGVARDPVMGGDWGNAVAPVLSWLFALSCLAFLVPLVLGVLAVRAGYQLAWIPIACSIAMFGFFGLSLLFGLAL